MDQQKEKPVVHFYDGIEEHDNPVPFWFSVLFYGTVLFGIGYYAYYETGFGTSLSEAYRKDVEAQQTLQLQNQGKTPLASDEELFALTKEPEKMKSVSLVYQSKCVSCHGAQGQGGIGPNLTDAYWIHGGKLSDIRNTVMNGVGDKGMPTWGAVLAAAEINQLAAYIHTLQGTNPPGAKAPQGNLEKP